MNVVFLGHLLGNVSVIFEETGSHLVLVKQSVRLLGIELDKFLCFYNRIIQKLIKIHNQGLNQHDQPVLLYSCQIWFNICPSHMELIRVFESKILRCCTLLYRSKNSNYKKCISNKISRFDNFIIQIRRNHIGNSSNIIKNNLILVPYYADEEYIYKTIENG